MHEYRATFSNGSQYTTRSKRTYEYAWRVEWRRTNGTTTDAGGFSSTRENAEKAMNAWVGRIRKGSDNADITFKGIAPAKHV